MKSLNLYRNTKETSQGEAEVPVLGKRFPSLSVQKTQKHLNISLGLTSRRCSIPILVSNTSLFVCLDSLHRTAWKESSDPAAQSDHRRDGCQQVSRVPGSSSALPGQLPGWCLPGTAPTRTSGRSKAGPQASPQRTMPGCDAKQHSPRRRLHCEFMCGDCLLCQLLCGCQ